MNEGQKKNRGAIMRLALCVAVGLAACQDSATAPDEERTVTVFVRLEMKGGPAIVKVAGFPRDTTFYESGRFRFDGVDAREDQPLVVDGERVTAHQVSGRCHERDPKTVFVQPGSEGKTYEPRGGEDGGFEEVSALTLNCTDAPQ